MPTALDPTDDVMEVEAVLAEDDDDDDDDEGEDSVAASVAVEDDDDGDDDEEEDEVMATVIVDGGNYSDEDEEVEDEEEAHVVSAPVEEEEEEVLVAKPVKKKAKKKAAPPKKAPVPAKRPASKKSKATASADNASSKSKKKKQSSSKKKSTPAGSSTATAAGAATPAPAATKSAPKVTLNDLYKRLPPQRVEAAMDARAMLQETAPMLPVPVGETLVRSFGRLYLQSLPSAAAQPPPPPASSAGSPGSKKKKDPVQVLSKFNTTSALYPIGFSCDRYEFSPVHGRTIKMRCSILDGRSVKAKQKEEGYAVQTTLPDGPVFRIMWGRGVDEETEIELPFDPSAHSPPIVKTGSKQMDALLKESIRSQASTLLPDRAMRVKVRFDNNEFYFGVVQKVGTPKTVTKNKKKHPEVDITILYDDGSTESITYPDPDVTLLMPSKSSRLFRMKNLPPVCFPFFTR
jgi:hypothetical protein